MVPDGQVATQAPAAQARPAGHTVPQAPQCWGLVVVSTHCPPQDVWPGEQAQTPMTQAVPPAQETPHAPQWASSRLVSTQLPEQAVRPAGQSARHCPALHT